MGQVKDAELRSAARGRVCAIDGCDRGTYAKGLCHRHYQKRLQAERAERGDTCKVDGCEDGRLVNGMCFMHHMREYAKKRRRQKTEAKAERKS